MKVVEITGSRVAALVERPDPVPAGDIVVVRIQLAPMCTEYKAYAAGHPSAALGHEAAGEVAAVAQPGRVREGDRVVVMPLSGCGRCPLCLRGDYIYCRQGRDLLGETGSPAGTATYAQFVLKPDWLLIPVPEDLSLEHASLACCGLGPTFGAMERLRVDAFDTVLITGMGPVGLGGVINGVARGARVLAVEGHRYRAALARDLGAEAVIDPGSDPLAQLRDLTDGEGVDKALDCSGVAAAQRLLIDATRRRGHVAFIGEGGELSLQVSRDLLRKGLTLHGSWHFNLADAPRLLQVIRRCRPLLDRLITHTFPMSRVADAFELQLAGECGKVLLDPWS
jgi:L-iditol 2-dehydrogenase